jgi:MFS family permease
LAFFFVSLSLGQLGDGLSIFQGIYLVNIVGWKEGSVGAALSLMGLTGLLVQPFAGDLVDKASIDRRIFLIVASLVTALSASTILSVHPNSIHVIADHALIYGSKILEGIASSFIAPCLAALTLASFGPEGFDAVMASNIFWGHVGSVAAAVLAGLVAYVAFPTVQACFVVIGLSALVAVWFVQFLPIGDPQLGRGFQGKATVPQEECVAKDSGTANTSHYAKQVSSVGEEETIALTTTTSELSDDEEMPMAASYLEVLLDPKTLILCLTGFSYQYVCCLYCWALQSII